MKCAKINKNIAALAMAGAVAVSVAACSPTKEHKNREEREVTEETEETETSEETTEETAEATTTEETTEETTVEETKAVGPDAPSCSVEEDDARYKAFFEGQYADLADKMCLTQNNVNVIFAYTDLDHDGSDELLIADKEGVYAVVTEVDGQYNEAEVCSWRIQYGAVPGEYLGNGCFMSSLSNGNNYGGEFSVEYIWKYETALHDIGVLARLSGSWDPNHLDELLSKWELYVANEGGIQSHDTFAESPDNANYTYSMLDYGDNTEYENGEMVPNEIQAVFYELKDSVTAESSLDLLTWRSVSDMPVGEAGSDEPAEVDLSNDPDVAMFQDEEVRRIAKMYLDQGYELEPMDQEANDSWWGEGHKIVEAFAAAKKGDTLFNLDYCMKFANMEDANAFLDMLNGTDFGTLTKVENGDGSCTFDFDGVATGTLSTGAVITMVIP